MPNTNTLTAVIPQILAQGLLALRNMAVLPRLVSRDYSTAAAQKGDTITIPLPGAVTLQDVTPSNTAPDDPGVTPETTTISLDKWKEAVFFLSDKDIQDAFSGMVPMTVSDAIAQLVEQVNADIFATYKTVYGAVGAAGTTPFASDYDVATAARKLLFEQKAPSRDRYMVVNPDAEENALNLSAFADASSAGSDDAIRDGMIGRKLGFDWLMDQQVPTHTAGTASGATTDTTGYAIGTKTVTLALAGTGTFVVGDIITFAGDTQQYVITSGDADVSNGGTISFEPGLKVAIETSAHAITLVASHAVNLAFHRAGIVLATRQMTDVFSGGSQIASAVDPQTGLTLRLEVSRQHKRTRWSFDMLYGAKVVRPEYVVRVMG